MTSTANGHHHKPALRGLLGALGLDVDYFRGSGATLTCQSVALDPSAPEGDESQVLDLVGGFGATLLGHSPPRLVARAQQLLVDGRPNCSQGSRATYAEELARKLSHRAKGDYCCVFANSGAEGVEIALKHAFLQTNSRHLLAIEGAFHGKTLGALQANGSIQFRGPFALPGLEVSRVPVNDLSALDAAFARAPDAAAFLFEPILGEGGVRPLSLEFARRAARHCEERGIPLIADECQTGCGRTGTWLACEQLGVRPDYLVLSKALGGGVSKIAATLIRRDWYQDSFDWLQSSTFAADDHSCAIGIETLEVIDAGFLNSVAERGERFRQSLETLANEFPDVIREIRGRGFMLGIEFHPRSDSPSFVFRVLSSLDRLLYLVAAFLLRRHRIRILPTLSAPWTLRLQPPVCVTDEQWRQLLTALRELCHVLRDADLTTLSSCLLHPSIPHLKQPIRLLPRNAPCAFSPTRFASQQSCPPDRRVAWICHMVDVNDLTQQEPHLGRLPLAERERLLERLGPMGCPVVMSGVDIKPRQGQPVRLYPILLPFSSRMARGWTDTGNFAIHRELLFDALVLAEKLGCSVVSLGQYNSILTRDGQLVSDEITRDRVSSDGRPRITSGNNYTVALAIEAVLRELADRGLCPEQCTLAVAGAIGNIGSTCASLLAPRFRRTLLLGSGRSGGMRRLQQLANSLDRAAVMTSSREFSEAHVVVSAINAADSPFDASEFRRDAIVCDVSVPSSVRAGTLVSRPDLRVFHGGIARLPHGEDLEIASYPLATGQVFGCLAEALLLGWDDESGEHLTGPVTPERVRHTAQIANRFGLTLDVVKRHCVLGTEIPEDAYKPS